MPHAIRLATADVLCDFVLRCRCQLHVVPIELTCFNSRAATVPFPSCTAPIVSWYFGRWERTPEHALSVCCWPKPSRSARSRSGSVSRHTMCQNTCASSAKLLLSTSRRRGGVASMPCQTPFDGVPQQVTCWTWVAAGSSSTLQLTFPIVAPRCLLPRERERPESSAVRAAGARHEHLRHYAHVLSRRNAGSAPEGLGPLSLTCEGQKLDTDQVSLLKGSRGSRMRCGRGSSRVARSRS